MKHMASARRKSNASGTSTRRKKTGRPAPRFVVCINNSGYPASLDLHKIYRVLPDEEAAREGDLRVVDESGEDYLYHRSQFILVELPAEVEQALTTV